MDLTEEENTVENPSQHDRKKRKENIKCTQTRLLVTKEKCTQTTDQDFEELRAIVNREITFTSDELREMKEEDLLLTGIKTLFITKPEPQQPLPSSETDIDSLEQQLSTSQSDSYLGEPQSLTSPTVPSSPSPDEIEVSEGLEAGASESSSDDTAFHKKRLCEEILTTNPLRGIGDFQIYFTQFYREFWESLSSKTKTKTKDEFSSINNDYERIKYVLRFEKIKKLDIAVHNSKSHLYANELEEECNNCCTSRETFPRALQLINRCIQFTPGTSNEAVAIRIMKRAWVRLLMTNFDEAQKDAHISLEYHSDPRVMWNTYEILGHCYAERRNNYTAECHLREALDGLRESNLDNVTKATSTRRIIDVLKMVKGRGNSGGPEKEEESLMTPRISYGINSILKCATEALEVRSTPETGRGMYAKRDLKPGDVIIVEKPYVSVLEKENFRSHCNYCYKRLKCPVPCDSCSWVWFCSLKCLRTAKAGFHSYECSILNLLYEESIGAMGILVFRIILRLTWENIKSLRKSEKINTRLPDLDPLHTEFSWQKKYFSDPYLNIYRLETNSQKTDFIDLFKMTIIAVYIKQCLKVVNFFKEDLSLDDEIFVASLILRHIQSSSFSGKSITEVIEKNGDPNLFYYELGGGLYPTFSLLNHSCDPNIFRYNVGDECVVRTTKVIRKGEQIFDNYGPMFETHHRVSRLEELQYRFKFDCSCRACKEHWPLYKENKVYMKFSCPENDCNGIVEYDGKKNMKCLSCGFRRRHEKLMAEAKNRMEEYKEGRKLLFLGRRSEALVELKKFQMYIDRNILPPSKCMTDCQELFQTCYFYLGNIYRST